MRKTTLGISLVALLGFAGTAAADHDHDGDCGHDGYSDYDDDYNDGGYAYADTDYDNYDDSYDYAANGWITPTVTVPVVQTVVVQPRAGYVWVEGRWNWTGYEWSWIDGYWLRTRANHDWHQGRWEYRNGHQRWRDGSWAPRTRVVVKTTSHRRWNDNDRNDRNDRRWGNGNKGKRWGNGHGRGRGTTKVVTRNHRRGRR